MALIGATSVLRAGLAFTALPQAGDLTGVGIGKDTRTTGDARLRGICDGDFNHINAEQSGARVRRVVDAAFQLFLLANDGGPRIVHDQLFIVCADDGMGVATPAGLNLTDLTHCGQVRDVENTQPAETLITDICFNT